MEAAFLKLVPAAFPTGLFGGFMAIHSLLHFVTYEKFVPSFLSMGAHKNPFRTSVIIL